MTLDQQSGIENEIRETEALESSSAVADVPHTVARDLNMFDGETAHTDTHVDVVVVVDVDIDEDVFSVVDVDVDVDVDIDKHVDSD